MGSERSSTVKVIVAIVIAQKAKFKRSRQFLAKLCLVSVSVYTLGCLSLWVSQNRFIFKPQREIIGTPETYKLKYQDVYLPVTTENGKVETMHGWWLPSDRPNAKVILYLHGNSKNISGNIEHANRFYKWGFSVFLVDYRGYGKSEGDFPTEARVYQDAQLQWEYLTQKLGIHPQDIVIYGHSLGGAIALELATKRPEAAGVIVEASFTSIKQMIDRDPKFAIFPVDLILNQRFDSISKVRSLKTPVLYIHGTNDAVIPYSMSEQLFAATPTATQLVTIPNGGHNNNAATNAPLYKSAVEAFTKNLSLD
jgi:pimeloyl-ACP methyl ester carboxylesterase